MAVCKREERAARMAVCKREERAARMAVCKREERVARMAIHKAVAKQGFSRSYVPDLPKAPTTRLQLFEAICSHLQ